MSSKYACKPTRLVRLILTAENLPSSDRLPFTLCKGNKHAENTYAWEYTIPMSGTQVPLEIARPKAPSGRAHTHGRDF